jgi:ASC-1-like (ASCH) protein
MIDILFLEYFMSGACRKIKNGDSFEFKNDSIEIDNSTIRSVRRTYARLLEDVKLAQLCGLVVRSNKNQNLLI